MRLAVLISTLLLAGCWSSDLPEVEIPTVPARDAVVQAVTMPSLADFKVTPEMVAHSVENVRKTVIIADTSKDSSAERIVKAGSVTDLSRVAAYAVGLGFLAFIVSGVLPIPGLRTTALSTIGIGAAIAILGPWLNDILGDDNARTISYVAFGIVAISASIGLGWYIIDKVKDETEHDDGQA